jgi:hypothetical protein
MYMTNATADMKTMYVINRGMPNLRCFWQNLSIDRLRIFKAIPPSSQALFMQSMDAQAKE